MTKSRFLETLRDKKDIFQSKLADFLTLMISFNNVIDEEKEKNPEVINFNNHLKMFKAASRRSGISCRGRGRTF